VRSRIVGCDYFGAGFMQIKTPLSLDSSNDQNLWMSLGEAAQVAAPSRG
jgi:hypothetical protein